MDGTKYLGALTRLEWLSLSGTQIGDEQMSRLGVLSDMQVLVLDNTSVTGSGLKHLKGMTKLRALYVRNTKVVTNEADEVKELLPNCTIFHVDDRPKSVHDYVPYTP
jgi:hypothetical protein